MRQGYAHEAHIWQGDLSGGGLSGGGLEVGGGLSGGGLKDGGGLQVNAWSAKAMSSCVRGKAMHTRHLVGVAGQHTCQVEDYTGEGCPKVG